MIALAILALGLVSLLVFTANTVFEAARVAGEHVAVELARGKMYDLEEEVLAEGFQELDLSLDGDFREEGHEAYRWTAKIEKVELPDLGALQGFGVDGTAEGGDGTAAGATASPLGGLLGSAGLGGTGTDPAASASDAMISSQFELIRGVLEEAIRKIT